MGHLFLTRVAVGPQVHSATRVRIVTLTEETVNKLLMICEKYNGLVQANDREIIYLNLIVRIFLFIIIVASAQNVNTWSQIYDWQLSRKYSPPTAAFTPVVLIEEAQVAITSTKNLKICFQQLLQVIIYSKSVLDI